MKKIWITVLSLFFSFSATAGNMFVDGMEDVPLPAGAENLPAADFEFGNDDTRLLEASYQISDSDFARVATFYHESMPQLGWTIQSISEQVLVFERGAEELTITCESSSPLVVRYSLTGRPE